MINMIKGLNEASNELGELAAGSEEAEERWPGERWFGPGSLLGLQADFSGREP